MTLQYSVDEGENTLCKVQLHLTDAQSLVSKARVKTFDHRTISEVSEMSLVELKLYLALALSKVQKSGAMLDANLWDGRPSDKFSEISKLLQEAQSVIQKGLV